MAKPVITNILPRDYVNSVGVFNDAGELQVSGTVAAAGVALTLSDTQGTVLARQTASATGTFSFLFGRFTGYPAAFTAGIHDLVVTTYPSGYTAAAGDASDPVEVSIGTAGDDTLAGPVLGGTVSGPRFVFGGPGNDLIQAYTLAPDAAGRHANGGVIQIDGGYDSLLFGTNASQNRGTDTVAFPVAIGAVSHVFNPLQINAIQLSTADATVNVTQAERLRFTDATVTVQYNYQLNDNPLTDFLYYDGRYPDLAAADANANAHYDLYGWHEGRDPDAFFSTLGYLNAYGDVKAAGVNPLNQFNVVGFKEKRDPSALFDTTLYLKFNPDVAQRAYLDPLYHYLQFGQGEGRKIYPVVGSAQVHDGFDPLYYALSNPDVNPAVTDLQSHYAQVGFREGRNPDAYFDVKYYLAQNPDVAASGIDPLAHYNQFGWHEGRNPSTHFTTAAYLAANKDVAAAGLNPLSHYLQYGSQEGRSPQGDIY